MRDALKFPRQIARRKDAAMQGGVQTEQFGPFPLQSPLRENTKFMDIRTLKDLRTHPEKSLRMQTSLEELIRSDQQTEYLKSVGNQLATAGLMQFKTTTGEQYTLLQGPATASLDRNRLALTSPANGPEIVRLIQTRGGSLASFEWVAREVRIKAYPDNDLKQLSLSVELQDAALKIGDETSSRDALERNFTVAMPKPVQEIADRTVAEYVRRPDLPPASARLLGRNLMKQNNSVESEMHSRVSFALSCVVLTMVGYGLGVMFKSGNYLNAFAVSVVPAIVCIVLIVTGQHICENVPPDITAKFHDPLKLGLTTIWTGNVLVLGIAVVLMTRLRRT